MITKTARQFVRSLHCSDCQCEKTEMKSDFVFAKDGSDQSDISARERGILRDFVHWHCPAIPVHLKTIWIRPMGLHLATCPNKQRIIDVKGLVCERQEASQRSYYQY